MKTKITYLLLMLPFLTFAQGPWEFNTDTDAQGWTAWQGGVTAPAVNPLTSRPVTVGTGLISFTTINAGGSAANRNPLLKNSAANMDGVSYNAVEIRVKNGTAATFLRVNADGTQSGIVITANDADYKTYQIVLNKAATIASLSFEFKLDAIPSNTSGINYSPAVDLKIEVDYIRPIVYVPPTRNVFNFDTAADVEGFTTLTRASAVQAVDGSNGTLQVKATIASNLDAKVALKSSTFKVDGATNKYAHITLKNASTNNRFTLTAGAITYLPYQAYTTGDASYKTYDFDLSTVTGNIQPDFGFGFQSTWLATGVYAVNDQVISSNSTYKNLTGINTANAPRADIIANAAAVPPLPQNWELVGTEGALLDLINSIYIDSIVFDTNRGAIPELGVNKFTDSGNKISLYPNPAKDLLNVSSANAISKIEVYDMTGKKLVSRNNASDINLSSLGKGVYIISVLQANGSVVAKQFVKE